MPVVPHPLIPTPAPDLPLWRYVNFTKVVSILTTGALWFARADKLGDPFEASVPNWVPALLHDTGTDSLYRMDPHEMEFRAQAEERFRSLLFTNCWYSGQIDSIDMWSSYGPPQDGVAIRTTVERLSSALRTDQHVTLSTVQYFDYSLPHPHPASPPNGPALYLPSLNASHISTRTKSVP
jgi:hypothetical protein